MQKIHLYDKIISPMVTEKSTNLSEQNKRMRLLDPHPKFMLKKVQVMLDMQVERLQYLLAEAWLMVQKEKVNIKKES